MKKYYDQKVIKKQLQGTPKKVNQKSLPKKSPKKILTKIHKKFTEKKTYILSKKGKSKKILQKSLKKNIYSYALACFTKYF